MLLFLQTRPESDSFLGWSWLLYESISWRQVPLALDSFCSLQAWDPQRLEEGLKLSADAASRVWKACRGLDIHGGDSGKGAAASAAASSPPPQSLVVTSWTTHTLMRDVASKVHLGRGGDPVVIGNGRWLFETHPDSSRSNATRCR